MKGFEIVKGIIVPLGTVTVLAGAPVYAQEDAGADAGTDAGAGADADAGTDAGTVLHPPHLLESPPPR
ncbi:MAG: hypothetical protein WAU39_14405, partial [Polyangiales bacterium]